jgi:hypothetical protein
MGTNTKTGKTRHTLTERACCSGLHAASFFLIYGSAIRNVPNLLKT